MLATAPFASAIRRASASSCSAAPVSSAAVAASVRSSCALARPIGSACGGNTECAGNHCVDGFCCDSACSGQCQACDVGSSLGRCTTVTSGQPHGNRTQCGGTGACAGSCSASNASACTFPSQATSCNCVNPVGLGACDGAGDCHALLLNGVLGLLCD